MFLDGEAKIFFTSTTLLIIIFFLMTMDGSSSSGKKTFLTNPYAAINYAGKDVVFVGELNTVFNNGLAVYLNFELLVED